jgi:hypothetical protein
LVIAVASQADAFKFLQKYLHHQGQMGGFCGNDEEGDFQDLQ